MMKAWLAVGLILSLSAGVVLADPPDHAPAHGWRKKHESRDYPPRYTGKTGVAYREDFGILSGRCDRDKIGAVIGGVTGAVIGSQVTREEDRLVGMVIGGVIGAILGKTIGDEVDRNDRACMGHALELGRPGVPVAWSGEGHYYRFTPLGETRSGCRYATLIVDRSRPSDLLACPKEKGEWEFRHP